MKKIGEYSCIGDATSGIVERITLFDGRFDTAYVLKSIKVANQDAAAADADVWLKVITDKGANNTADSWNWDDNREIGWASTNHRGDTSVWETFTFVNPDNLIVEDAWICVKALSGSYPSVNYSLEFEKVELKSDWVGALAMVRNSGQGAPTDS